VTGLSGHLKYKTVRERNCGRPSILLQRGDNDLRTLDRQVLMVEQDLKRRTDLSAPKPVDGHQDPRELQEHKLRDPGSSRNESLRRRDLSRIVADG